MLTIRQQKLLIQIIQENEYIQPDRIAQEYGISLRTVRHDLLLIEEWLQKYSIPLERHRKLGVKILLDQGQLQMLTEQLQQRPDYIQGKERVKLLLKQLLEESTLSIEQVMEKFGISRNTFIMDLSTSKEWLTKRGLDFVKERGRVSIIGMEKNQRNAYLELLREEISNERILQVMLQTEENELGLQPWNQWFRMEDTQYLFDVVSIVERKLSIEFSDASYSALILHLLMAMERLKNNHSIRMDEQLLEELQNTDEFEVLRNVVVPKLKAYFKVDVPLEEIGYITQHVLGAQKEQEGLVGDNMYISLAKQIVMQVEKELGHPLLSLNQVINGLAVHLKPAMYRAKFGLQTENPLLQQLEQEYAPVLDIIVHVVNRLMEPHSIRFNRNEIGYIAMHICSGLHHTAIQRKKRVALVCSSGLGTAAILQRKMSALFPQVTIVGRYSYKDLTLLKAEKVDMILSTLEISYPLPIPWLRVSPLLPKKDQEKLADLFGVAPPEEHQEGEAVQTVNEILHIVERHAQNINHSKLSQELFALFQRSVNSNRTTSLTDLLPMNSILLRQRVQNWEEAIRLSNQPLRERGCTGLAYEEKLIQIVQQRNHHFIITEGVAFPHTSAQHGVWKTGFSLVTFDSPLLFGPSETPIWLMITLAAVDQHQHIQALSTLLDALHDQEWIDDVQQSSDQEKIWQRLKMMEGVIG